ncbi:MAG: hypothetical protein Q9226_003074 [Calogaya cf. arnoldii]
MSSNQNPRTPNDPFYLVYYLPYGQIQWGLYSRSSPVEHISTNIDNAFTFCTTKLAKQPISDKDAFFSELANKWIIWRDDGSAYCAVEKRQLDDLISPGAELENEGDTAQDHRSSSTENKESGKQIETGQQKTHLGDLNTLESDSGQPATRGSEGSEAGGTGEPQPPLGDLELFEMEIEKPQDTSPEEVHAMMEEY